MKSDKVAPDGMTDSDKQTHIEALKEKARELAREIVHTFVEPDGVVERAERICEISAKLEGFAQFFVAAPASGQDGWVSVKERLPKLTNIGVGYEPCEFYSEMADQQYSGWYDPIYSRWIVAHPSQEETTICVIYVTHWRELPSPPSPEPGKIGEK